MDDIIGVWIGDNDSGLYQELFVSNDGTGWFEYGRADYSVIWEFAWLSRSPNRISFEYRENREVDGHESVRGTTDEPASYSYELINGKTLRFTPPYSGTRDYHRGERNSPYRH